jgi:predicted metal-binding membrane protein
MDLGWVVAVALRLPDPRTVDPVCNMLGIVTGAVAGIYGFSTVKSSGVIETVKETMKKVFQKAE